MFKVLQINFQQKDCLKKSVSTLLNNFINDFFIELLYEIFKI